MNRDYFARPLQGNGRDFSDYGRTDLRDLADAPERWWVIAVVVGGALAAAYFVWQFLR